MSIFEHSENNEENGKDGKDDYQKWQINEDDNQRWQSRSRGKSPKILSIFEHSDEKYLRFKILSLQARLKKITNK